MNNLKLIINTALVLAVLINFQSCTNESPFDYEGEGTLQLQTEYKSDLIITSRAENGIDGYTEEELNNKLVVYIENEKGVIRKYIQKASIPEKITLPAGTYTVEGWTGDSASADWNKKFFRGYQSGITVGEGNNSIKLQLNIANVVVKIDKSALDLDIEDLKVKVYHSRGELIFTDKEIGEEKRGYFMIPIADQKDKSDGNKDAQIGRLGYVISGKTKDGQTLDDLTGDIDDVKRGYLYNIKLSSDEIKNDKGGTRIKIEIEEKDPVEQSFEIFPAPSFKAWVGVGGDLINLEDQIVFKDQNYQNIRLRVVAFPEFRSLKLKFSDNFKVEPTINGVDFKSDNQALETLTKNIDLQFKKSETTEADEAWLIFKSESLSLLEESPQEYSIELEATDSRGYVTKAKLRFANSEEAIETPDPIVSDPSPEPDNKPLAILSNKAELTGYILDENSKEFGIMYAESGSNNFVKVQGQLTNSTRATSKKEFKVTLTDLKPGTTYQYKSYCDGFVEKETKSFTTEAKFSIPNADMSQWSTCNDVTSNTLIPNANGKRTFWDTGNHGSMSLGALGGKNITENDNSFISDNTVARLKSQFIGVVGVGKFAAGNLFVGEFIKTVGTSGAQLKFGREFNDTHPSALKVKVNYRPGTVDYSENDALPKGETDQGQIFIAVASSQSELNTANGIYFDERADNIIGYNEITFKNDIGVDNQLQEITIPIKYYDKAKSTAASYIIIVCSASKYGDYFTGSTKSVMYVDDFELEYGDIQFEN